MISIQPLTGAEVVEQTIRQVRETERTRGSKPRTARALAGSLGIGLTLAGPILAAAGDGAAVEAKPSTNAPVPKVSFTKPDWLIDLAVSAKESYDDNVFVSGTDPSKYPAGTDLSRVPSGIAVALKERPAFVTTVSPKVGVNFASLLGDQKVLQLLSLGYSPDFVNFHGKPSENYNAHRLAAAVKLKSGDFSLALENSFNAIDGNRYGPLFPGGLNSSYSTAALRERRNQYQDRNAVTLQYDLGKFFIRPTSSLLYYDLRTAQLTRAQAGGQSGYQNYADRYDVNGGADIGYRISPNIAATVGYRYGAQYQEKYSRAIDPLGLSSSSDYQRVLFGVEGKPVKWLEAKLQIGPDFRSYGSSAAVANRDPLDYYGEASLTATITPNDSVTFKYKQYEWVSSTGRVPYFDSSYDLTYKRKFTSQLALELNGRFGEADYTSGLDPTKLPGTKAPNPRNDSETILTAGLTYALNANASVSIAYSFDFGRNLQEGLANDSTREFNRNLVTLGANFKF